MMKKRILVDMDGVLANVYISFINKQYTEKGIKKEYTDLIGLKECVAFPNLREIACSKSFFYNVPIMPDAIETLEYLNNKYEVIIVSSATEFPGCIDDKQKWLNKHFPFIKWEQMVFCGKKHMINGDIMIDDHPKNLDTFNGDKIIFTQPHNVDQHNYTRINNWKEIYKIL